MKKDWLTSTQDLYVARQIINRFRQDDKTLGIFEVVSSDEGKDQVFLSEWVMILTEHFRKIYGLEQGDFVMRKIVSKCLINGEQVH